MRFEAARVEVAALTHQGRVRPNNEDCIVAGDWLQNEPMSAPRLVEDKLDAPLVCMVLDGMGGQAGGEVAAYEAGRFLARALPACDSEAAITQGIREANALIYRQMQHDPRYRAMGATLAGVRLAPESILAFNVGDSRIYRVQDGSLSQLSVDDIPPPRPGRPDSRSGVITQSIGGASRFTEIQPHVSRHAGGAPWTYLLCSDGLYDALGLHAMEAAIDEDLGASASRLIERALDAGARDNVSIVLVRLV